MKGNNQICITFGQKSTFISASPNDLVTFLYYVIITKVDLPLLCIGKH